MERQILAQITFGPWRKRADQEDVWLNAVDHTFHGFMGSLLSMGQIIGDTPRGVIDGELRAFVRLPRVDAMERRHYSKYALRECAQLPELFGCEPSVTILDPGEQKEILEDWRAAPWLILYDAGIDGIAPVRDHELRGVPGYLLPLNADQCSTLRSWSGNQRSHSDIWLASGSLEKESLIAMSDARSDLNVAARKLARMVEISTQKPVYADIFRYHAFPFDREMARPCPLCGAAWKVEGERFDFRCEPCRIVSRAGTSEDGDDLAGIGQWTGRAPREPYGTFLLASADSLRGMLQRGRGRGLLEVLKIQQENAWSLIEDCLWNDPRLDRQCESRDWFYGTLMLRTQMPLSKLTDILDAERDAGDGDMNTLALDVLGWLGSQGRADALDALERYIEHGHEWERASWGLIETQILDAAERIARAIQQRIPDSQSLADAISEAWNLDDAVLQVLAQHNSPLVQDAVRSEVSRRLEQDRNQDTEKESIAKLTALELVAASEGSRQTFLLGKQLRALVTPKDGDWLLAQLSIDHPKRSEVALRGLEGIVDVSMAEPLLAFLHAIAQTDFQIVHARLRQILLNLPAAIMLPLARQWINETQGCFRSLASDVFVKHAEPCDIPLLSRSLAESLDDEESQVGCICDWLDALARMRAHGAVAEVEAAFQHMQYAYGRNRAAMALASMHPELFKARYADECRFDCQDGTRMLAEEANAAG